MSPALLNQLIAVIIAKLMNERSRAEKRKTRISHGGA
jgi:hypothetical protein